MGVQQQAKPSPALAELVSQGGRPTAKSVFKMSDGGSALKRTKETERRRGQSSVQRGDAAL